MLNRKTIRISTCIFFILIILYIIYSRLTLIGSRSTDLDGAEFTFIRFLQVLLGGNPLYRDPCEYPFLVVMYTPLYPYILYWCSILLGFTADTSPHALYVLARLIAFIFAFVNVFFICKVFRLLNFSFFATLTAVVFYLLFITGHFYVARPDAIKLSLFSLLLFALFKYLFYGGSWKYAVVVILSGLTAVLLKQDAVFYIYILLGTALIYLWNSRTIYLALWFTAGLAATLGAVRLIAGDFFFDNVFLFNFQVTTNVFKTFNTVAVSFSVARSLPLLLIVSFGCFFAVKNFRDKSITGYMAMAALASYCLAHLAMFRAGAYLNYTFEAILLTIIASALILRTAHRRIAKRRRLFYTGMITYVVVLFGLSILILSYRIEGRRAGQYSDEYKFATLDKRKIEKIIGNDIVFFINPKHAVFYPKANTIYGYEMHFDRLVDMLHGFQSSTKLLFVSTENYDSYFNEGKVKYIITENSESGKRGVEKYYPQYELLTVVKQLAVYQYKLSETPNN